MYQILICDDEPDIVNALKIYLSSERDYKLFEAYTGAQALDLVRRETIHLILMDVMMPVRDGHEATRAIRAMDRPDAKTIPIFAMTANAFTEDRRKALESGMNEHLPKPIDPDALYRLLVKYLTERS